MDDKQLEKRINDLVLEGGNLIGGVGGRYAAPNTNEDEQIAAQTVLQQQQNGMIELPSPANGPVPRPQFGDSTEDLTLYVRVLHGGVGIGELSVTIGDSVGIPFMMYGDITEYYKINNGFQTVTVTTLDAPKEVLFFQVVPFAAGTRVTFVIFKSVGGMDIRQVPEIPCFVPAPTYGCFRAINLLETSVAKNVVSNDNRTIFSEVRYKEITNYTSVEEGDYIISVFDWQKSTEIRHSNTKPIISFNLTLRAAHQYSIYIIDTDVPVEVVQILIIKN